MAFPYRRCAPPISCTFDISFFFLREELLVLSRFHSYFDERMSGIFVPCIYRYEINFWVDLRETFTYPYLSQNDMVCSVGVVGFTKFVQMIILGYH